MTNPGHLDAANKHNKCARRLLQALWGKHVVAKCHTLSLFPILFCLPRLSFPNPFFFSRPLLLLFPDSTQLYSAPCTPPHATLAYQLHLFPLRTSCCHSTTTTLCSLRHVDFDTRFARILNEATHTVVTNRACGVLVS